jgi:dTDP-6-deoxy-L-talose 4-dehydrogenase (NAD+)
MNIAVTGASGFLGRHVTAELLRRGLNPVLATRNPAALTPCLPQANVVHLDLHSPPNDPFAALGRPDLLIHLAWQGLPNYSSLAHLEFELPAHISFLKSLVATGLQTLAVTGTCLEYGISSGLKTESMIAEPSTAYAVAKDTLRKYLQIHQQSHPFQLIWHRLFYLYGPGQSNQAILPQLHRAIANGETSFKMSGGQQLRDFHHVTSAAREIVELALKQQSLGIVNGCSGQPTSVRSFVERYLAENGLTIKLDLGHYPYTDYEPFAFWGDASYLHRCLTS